MRDEAKAGWEGVHGSMDRLAGHPLLALGFSARVYPGSRTGDAMAICQSWKKRQAVDIPREDAASQSITANFLHH